MENRDRIFGGPYFFAVVGLYMRPWTMNFVPEQETFTLVPVWIRLYSLPLDYWMRESLKAIGNKLGHFLKISEATLRGKYTSYAHICVEMDLSGALPDEVILEVYDEEWVQAVDYEHIPFKCHKCHEHGHLSGDCPLNQREENLNPSKGKDQTSFTKVVGKGKGGGRKTQKSHRVNDNTKSYNNFDILGEKEIKEGDKESAENRTARGKEKETSVEYIQEKKEHVMDSLNTMVVEKDKEMTQSECVKANKSTGGILTLWDPQKFRLIGEEASRHHLSLIFQPMGDRQCYMITNVYGPQPMEDKLQLLTTLEDMKKRYPALPWILGGDFKITKSLMEKKGETRILGRHSIAFQNFITNMKLVDMETSNGIFTWNNKRGGPSQVASKLDKLMLSDELLITGSNITTLILPFWGSDH
eukprot:PITA_24856